ncbi:hypothetical protein ACIQV3_35875 [Streptomyces sp. NPDC099050]|uniref:hypothetical protein n=1 Tax=Streptomyces sp. NPDC099050 TaxID=3366100 RepID=UPI003803AA0A
MDQVNLYRKVLAEQGAHCGCQGACGKDHSGTCRAGATGKPVRLITAPYPPHPSDAANAAAPPDTYRPWCGPCWGNALIAAREALADTNEKRMTAAQILLFDLPGAAA